MNIWFRIAQLIGMNMFGFGVVFGSWAAFAASIGTLPNWYNYLWIYLILFGSFLTIWCMEEKK